VCGLDSVVRYCRLWLDATDTYKEIDMKEMLEAFRQSWRNGRDLGDSPFFIIRMALCGRFVTDDALRRLLLPLFEEEK